MGMAIGVKADHIFQGIIYGKPHHPLLRQAIQHAFGRQVFAAKANLEYMIFCKSWWEVLRKDMGQVPTVGWNVTAPSISSRNAVTRSDRRLTTTTVATL